MPPGSTISGIEVDLINAKSTDSSGCYIGAELSSNAGSSFTTTGNKTEITSTTGSNFTIGGPINTWGRGWYGTDFLSGSFVVRLQDVRTSGCTSRTTLSLDQLKVTVTYASLLENSDGDNFFIAPTAADMGDIFDFIGNTICPAATATPANPPTTATLYVVAQVVNSNGGSKQSSDFTTTVTPGGQSPTSSPGSPPPGVAVTIDPGTYTVTEANVDGYVELPGSECTADSSNPIAAGETRVCVFTNEDIPPPPPPPNLNITTGSWQETP